MANVNAWKTMFDPYTGCQSFWCEISCENLTFGHILFHRQIQKSNAVDCWVGDFITSINKIDQYVFSILQCENGFMYHLYM